MPESGKHISSSFDAALYGLKNDVLMMSSLTDRIFQTAFEALLNRDNEVCDQAINEDDQIDFLEKQVDQDGVNLLIRFHPVASDMRQVISAMKISTNLERIGDQSVTIARRAKRLNSRPRVDAIALLEPAFRLVLSIFHDSVRAFAEDDCEVALTLKPRDKELDALSTELGEKLLVRATADPESMPSYLDLIFVSRALDESEITRPISLRIHSGANRHRTFGTPIERQQFEAVTQDSNGYLLRFPEKTSLSLLDLTLESSSSTKMVLRSTL